MMSEAVERRNGDTCLHVSPCTEEDPILTGRNGKVQRRRRTRRRLFGAKAQAAFLESFACTANAAASAEAIGFSVGVVFTHRRTDPEFRGQYWAALEQAVGKLAPQRAEPRISLL